MLEVQNLGTSTEIARRAVPLARADATLKVQYLNAELVACGRSIGVEGRCVPYDDGGALERSPGIQNAHSQSAHIQPRSHKGDRSLSVVLL